MDAISAAAFSINSPILSGTSLFLDSQFIFSGVLLLALVLGENREEKRRKIALSVILAVLCSYGIKLALAIERPCAGEIWCPSDYSFPSLHATAAFSLMIGFLNKKSFPLYLLFALFTGFTRLNLGVHIFADIAAALPIAIISYYVIDLSEQNGKRN